MLEVKCKTLCVLGKHSVTKFHPEISGSLLTYFIAEETTVQRLRIVQGLQGEDGNL